MSKPVSLTGQYKDYGNDTDGDGYCDCLTLEVEIVVNREGEYSISGCLMACRDPSGQSGYTIGWSERVVLAKLGQQKLKLDFVGTDIYHSGMDGPYVIELLQSPAQGDIVVIEDVTAKDKGI